MIFLYTTTTITFKITTVRISNRKYAKQVGIILKNLHMYMMITIILLVFNIYKKVLWDIQFFSDAKDRLSLAYFKKF